MPNGKRREPAVERSRRRRLRTVAMRPRRVLVLVHRWLALALVAWVVVVAATGAWLVSHDAIESWFHGGRYDSTPGDVGPQAATDAALAAFPDGAESYGLTMPGNGRGVYLVYGEVPPPESAAETAEWTYLTAYVDPGSATVNEVRNEEEGATWWLYRGHMYLWQDHGIAGVFHPESGWCRAPTPMAVEPGGVKGVVCDVIPNGDDMVAWMALGFIVVLLTGFYLWYWPGVRRWATAFVIRRRRGPFAFNLSVHKVVGFVVWLPLLVVAFTGATIAFPNMNKWFENATPAQRDFDLWVPGDDVVSDPGDGAEPIGLDRAPRRSWPSAIPTGRCTTSPRPSTRPGTTWRGSPGASTRGRARVAPATPISPSTSTRVRRSTTARPRRATSSTRRGMTGSSRCTPATSAAPSPVCCGPRSASRRSSSQRLV